MTRENTTAAVTSGFFAWRTPALAFDVLRAWSEGLKAPRLVPDDPGLGAALEEDRRLLRRRLRALVDMPAVREAIFVASSDLESRLTTWREKPESAKGRGIESAVVRYIERMTTRPTPFGLFSSCSVGRIDRETALDLGPATACRRHSRLDMHYLTTLAGELEKRPELRDGLTYRVNSSLYRAAARYRYAEGRVSGSGRSYHLVAVDVTDYLEAAIARARTPATRTEIAEAVCRQRPDVAPEEAVEYVGQLIDSQILVSDLSPVLTGPDPAAELLTTLRGHLAAADTARVLERATTELGRMDADGTGIDPARYRDLAAQLEALPARVEPNRLFQVDLVRPATESRLGETPVAEILRGVKLLRRLQRRGAHDPLRAFRDAFLARYDGREVPLVQVLDDEVGVGLADGPTSETSPLLADLDLRPSAQEAPSGATWQPWHDVLLTKLLDAAEHRADEVVLDDADLERMAVPDPERWPASFAVTAVLAAPSAEDLAAGNFLVRIAGAGGPSGARMLGRFCHADEELRRGVEAHLRAEERHDPDAIFAEIVHLPEGRLGNILFRPVLREHEIPFLGRSGAPPERQIPVDDLVVSVREGRAVLRSRRLGREIVPRLTSAHNFSHGSLPVYRFLGALQGQGISQGVTWSWGPLEGRDVLPRVRYGRVILSRARWVLPREELAGLADDDAPGRFRRVQAWRAERRMPRFVLLTDSDNELLVDLDNIASIDAFADLARKRPTATLTEMFPQPEALVARGPEGTFVHDLVVPFVTPAPADVPGASAAWRTTTVAPASAARVAARRTFPPGSEWLYAKLYTGTSTADRVLRDTIAGVVRDVLARGSADRWFFIRYVDPEFHLRLRFHGEPHTLAGDVLPALEQALAPLRKEGVLWRFQLDTYEREIERYGGADDFEAVEEVFRIDSEAVLGIVSLLEGDAGADARWRLALYGLDRLLDDLGFDEERRLAVARGNRILFSQEFGVQKPLRIRLGNKFRAHRRGLEALLSPAAGATHELAPALRVFRTRSERLAPLLARLRESLARGRFKTSMDEMAMHLGHMFVNRLLLSGHRAQELVLWDFLTRLYESRAARTRAIRKNPEPSGEVADLPQTGTAGPRVPTRVPAPRATGE